MTPAVRMQVITTIFDQKFFKNPIFKKYFFIRWIIYTEIKWSWWLNSMNNFANRRFCFAIRTIIFCLYHKNSRRRLAIDDIPTTPINHQHHHIVKAGVCCVYVYGHIYICIIFIVITIFRDNFFHLSVNKTLTEVIIPMPIHTNTSMYFCKMYRPMSWIQNHLLRYTGYIIEWIGMARNIPFNMRESNTVAASTVGIMSK